MNDDDPRLLEAIPAICIAIMVLALISILLGWVS